MLNERKCCRPSENARRTALADTAQISRAAKTPYLRAKPLQGVHRLRFRLEAAWRLSDREPFPLGGGRTGYGCGRQHPATDEKCLRGATDRAHIWVGQRGDSQASNTPEGSVAAVTRERRSRDRHFDQGGREEGGRRRA